MNKISFSPGDILRETSAEIKNILGSSIESIKVEKIVIGLFFTCVKLNNGHGGLCFTPIRTVSERYCYRSAEELMPASGRLKNYEANKILDEMWNGNSLRKAIGIAVLNALSSTCWNKIEPEHYSIKKGINALKEIIVKDNGYAVVIGALAPAFNVLKNKGIPFKILELYSESLKEDEFELCFPVESAEGIVPQADLLIINPKTLINDTLEGFLEMSKPGAKIIILGPTASMLPEAFFCRGVDCLGGVIISDIDRVMDVVSEAGSGYHFFEKGTERIVISR